MDNNPIATLAAAWHSAKLLDLPDVNYTSPDMSQGYEKSKDLPRIEKTRRPYDSEMELSGMFVQSWSSTALGFGGVGGQAITAAYTTIIYAFNRWCVYFNGRLAYKVDDPNGDFFLDISKQDMAEVYKAGKYVRKAKAQT